MLNFKIYTEQEQLDNINRAYKALMSVNTHSELVQLAKCIIAQQQGVNGNHLFPKGKSKQFWDSYKQKKQLMLNKQREQEEEVA